ncbi:dipeptidyl aminopeptidase/acylaminoacyl peptidase [Pontibacter ummariensis]|uniref:Dipeptidyl aminopeptidase/acylaminoacyl peptidase n=1 Tax=Pontibacter ummariensis TaxID=1610492 RepID=A0A239HA87_9BACT|nr:prolyl oligopeptidase family serine peptidase [Pontibacter ummariensis]PRY10682.1 dipeptidyl aminopeptidase/acylaminoacyl peptidase [Pontibacter ummariensis]SNS78277.1 Dipeptidyl aminopeptidase/acylaminoacyl peptidase [Pontibacter ummariensis]
MFLKRKAVALAAYLLLCGGALQAQEGKMELSVEKIMRDPKWIGTSPSNVFWSEDGKKIYFNWNPEGNREDSLYSVSADGKNIRKVSAQERRNLPSPWGDYNRAETKKVYEKNGDIFLYDIKSGTARQITNTVEREGNPAFNHSEQKVVYEKDGNLYAWNMASGQTVQLTDFRKGRKAASESSDAQRDWLKEQQLTLLQIVRDREGDKEARKKQREADAPARPKEIYVDDKAVDNITLSPDERFITYRLVNRPKSAKVAIVPNYVTASGYTEDINTRTKVGDAQSAYEFFVYDTAKDTAFAVSMNEVVGIYDQPAYLQEKEAKASAAKEVSGGKAKKPEVRPTIMYGPYWSDNGKQAVVVARSQDNKDRWIMKLEPATGKLTLLDRQRDEAWINGPGIGYGAGDIGWMPDNEHVWFQSEESGYSHLYTVNVNSGQKKALTSGKFEVSDVRMSDDKKHWYFTANKVHPGEQHLYRLPLQGGELVQLTSMQGANEVKLSPDEKTLAVRHSYSNKPWELYVMDNKKGAKAKQVTNSLTEEFKSYDWREPEVITFKAEDGADVYARLYRPEKPEANGPAVVFVHGAGYLQNAHKWWSSYFREYMFHNFLADQGYTVLDIDYRGSAGYGRDVRTGIYRFMGGKDLSDHVDGAKHLVEKYNVDPKRIGIYGGSYGGFITLMAMFTEPDVFAAGAALRSVTDWAHYNHGYTSNILNTPYTDSTAYAKSSPIYYAEGLKGALLIAHGMVDTNVHFQDVVRLTQRLIELGKDNWELAVYPVEDHGFVEPASWTDEYKRIYKLFEENLKEKD